MKIMTQGIDDETNSFLKLKFGHISVQDINIPLIEWLKYDNYDLALIDVSKNIDCCKEPRNSGIKTIIIGLIDADESFSIMKCKFLQNGGDDLLSKQNFTQEELLSIINARVRRYKGTMISYHTFTANGHTLEIDLITEICRVNGVEIHFTSKQIKLLCVLALNADKILTRGYLQSYIYGDDVDCLRNTFDTLVHRVSKKILAVTGDTKFIILDKGVGLKLPRSLPSVGLKYKPVKLGEHCHERP